MIVDQNLDKDHKTSNNTTIKDKDPKTTKVRTIKAKTSHTTTNQGQTRIMPPGNQMCPT